MQVLDWIEIVGCDKTEQPPRRRPLRTYCNWQPVERQAVEVELDLVMLPQGASQPYQPRDSLLNRVPAPGWEWPLLEHSEYVGAPQRFLPYIPTSRLTDG